MKKKSGTKDTLRVMGGLLMFLGSIMLALCVLFLGTLAAFGSPATLSFARLSLFFALGLGLGVGGYRVASGTWSGFTQMPHWAAALGGLLFLGSSLRVLLFTDGPVAVRSTRFTVSMAASFLVISTWWVRARKPKRAHGHAAPRNPAGTSSLQQEEEPIDLDIDDSLLKEVSRPDYFERARMRAQRRKSAWNLALIPSVLVPLGALWRLDVIAAEALHAALYPGQYLRLCQGLGTILVVMSPFFGALPVAMLVGNFLVRLIPPARRVLDEEAKPLSSTSYWSAQKQMLKIALVLVPVSLLFSIIGALLQWH